VHYLGSTANFDAEKIMPLVVKNLPVGLAGLFMAVLLAALMSTLSAIINVTSNVILNDFLKRYFAKNLPEKSLVRLGMLASSSVILIGICMSFMYEQIISAWELLLYIMLTMILVPAALRWHWWRFGPKAFLWSMVASTMVVVVHKIFLNDLPLHLAIVFLMTSCFLLTVLITFLTKPADMEILERYYVKVRPFGFWGPVRRLAVQHGLVPAKDPMPAMDVLNAVIASFFQLCLGIFPLYMFLKEWTNMTIWLGLCAGTMVILYFTWYRYLPSPEEP
jgi:Na+/proline symporter